MNTEQRFWAKVNMTGDCWLWTASLDRNGYARFNAPGHRYAHRYAYELLVGPIPEGLVLDHLCRTVNCVNPAHLEPTTIADNVRRGIALIPRKTHCKNGHEIAGDNVKLRDNGQPRCRICQNIASRDYYRRKALQAQSA